VTRAVIVCDGARRSGGVEAADVVIELSHSGPKANVNLKIESPSHALRSPVGPVSSDLLKIAAYAYSADRQISRGGSADLYGKDWQREFTVYLPVARPGTWEACNDHLSETLEFASGDKWLFRFSQAEAAIQQVPLQFDPNETAQDPDCVCLLSGGLDSLCGAVESVTQGRRPLLVGHSPAFNVRNRRTNLIREMRRVLGGSWQFPQVSAAVSRTDGRDSKEDTQRTRSFLYAALGAIFAERLGLPDVLLADNGVVSLNLPISPQLVGTLASRSTHPKFIRLFNSLLCGLYDNPPTISNPLWSRTRAETLEVLSSPDLRGLVSQTVSCSKTRLQVPEKRHCGVCSQCIDRRFATAAARLEKEDDLGRYALDFFRDSLPPGDGRTMVLSYHAFCLKVAGLSGERIFQEYPELFECVTPGSPNQRVEAQALVDMLHRHAATVLRVTEEQINAASHDMARLQLPPDCFISLLGSQGTTSPTTPPDGFKHNEDYTSVDFHGTLMSFTPTQACVIRLLDETRQKGPPGVRHAAIIVHLQQKGFSTQRVRDLFLGSPAWHTLVITLKRGLYALAD